MYRVYECELSKKKELMKVLEAEPYKEDSFARIGYKVKEGASLDENKEKLYVYISASEDFVKKADEMLKDIAKPASKEIEDRVGEKRRKEEEEAESGFGSIFGE